MVVISTGHPPVILTSVHHVISLSKTDHLLLLAEGSEAWYTLATKSTVDERGDKSATKSTVADTVDFTLLPMQSTVLNSTACRSRQCHQLGVADTVDFVASVYGAKATRFTLSSFKKVDRVEFNFVAGVYRA